MFSFNEPEFVIRKISTTQKEVFLTFDDGPNAETTPAVLQLLKKYNATATFFVIGQQVEKYPEVIQQIKDNKHAILSHSIDHNYANYFKSTDGIQKWLQESILSLQKQTEIKQYAFRPPAGILNPPLLQAAKNLNLPLILWNHRYYDSIFSLSEKKILKSIKKMQAGDIILLHDQQKMKNQTIFLKYLDLLIMQLIQQGFSLNALSEEKIKSSVN